MFYSKPWADALVVLLIVVLFFGTKRLPQLGRSLGEGMREFKDSITGKSGLDDDDADRPAVSEASSAPAEAPPEAPSAPAQPVAPAEPVPAAPPEAAAPQSAPVVSSERRS